MKTILVTGAMGQIGTELVPALCERYGGDNVIASDIRMPSSLESSGARHEHLDCTNRRELEGLVHRYGIDTIFHLAGILSAVGETKPQATWSTNVDGLFNVLEAARKENSAVFFPSSIGAFGPTTPRDCTPQETLQRPTSMYGVSKVAGELLCDYFHARFGVDTRGLRLPGLISYVAPPGGGTTDYAVDIFYHAIRYARYVCVLRPDTRLDMMYMPDALAAMIALMDAEPDRLKHRNAFNVSAMSITPVELAEAIRGHIGDFEIQFEPDPVRQAIADSWPRAIACRAAREEWGFEPRYDLAAMAADMIVRLKARLSQSGAAEDDR